ncbi:tegument protein [Bubaline alphaherpesvirus 1]|uniref:Tegument protein UL46 homolog n=1 Tax=Bubaline alphaherpesvirus 1 TaxID=202910 RepID=A0A1L5JKE8_9ALPH|nr:tegument protein [Bubaline alphaherpesvirus 1]APO15870.1 tegument protein [Bubaline alphaherpesvirus 1]WPD94472.1 UL46 [Bubaline alphaherpesvirus 1]
MAWAAASRGLIERRAEKGCLLPTLADATAAAVVALQEATEPVCGAPLFGAERAAALLGVRSNAVPEALVLSDSAKDADGEYRLEYDRAAARVLAGARLSKDAVWRAVIGSYWKYLKTSSGADVNIDSPAGGAAMEQAQLTNVMLFAPTYARRASRSPFKHRHDNAAYKAAAAELRGALRAVEKYMYYMRPGDPMVESPDTETRLQEILAYAATAYRWLLWFMDTLDGTVLRKLGKRPPAAVGPREPRPPGELCERHLTAGPGVACGSGAALMLTALTAAALALLMRVGAAWTESSWKSNTHGVTGAIVAAVELASAVHHHLQYLLNMAFVGYACWLRAGVRDPYMISAIRAQCRFAHFMGPLMPTMTSASWAALERGTASWFKLALLKSVAAHGAQTSYYSNIVESMRLGGSRGLLAPVRRRGRRGPQSPATRPLPSPPAAAAPPRSRSGSGSGSDSDSDSEPDPDLGLSPAVGVYASMRNLEGAYTYADADGPRSPAAARREAAVYENENEAEGESEASSPPFAEGGSSDSDEELAIDGPMPAPPPRGGSGGGGGPAIDGPMPAPPPRGGSGGGRRAPAGAAAAGRLQYANLCVASSEDEDETYDGAGAGNGNGNGNGNGDGNGDGDESEAGAAAPSAADPESELAGAMRCCSLRPAAPAPCTERPGNPTRSYSRSRPRLRALEDPHGLEALAAAGAAHTARHNRDVWRRFSRASGSSDDDYEDYGACGGPRPAGREPPPSRARRPRMEMVTSL